MSFRYLLWAKWRGALNATRSARGGISGRALTFLLLGGGFWGGTFAAVYWFLDQCQRVEIFGDVLIEQLMGMVLLIVLSVLLFSNLVASFSTYFLADDMGTLMTEPIPPNQLYGARFVELLVQSSWMVALFSLPVFVSVGLLYSVPWTYYVALPFTLGPLLIIATAVATLVSLLLTSLMPAQRTREVLLILAALVFVVLFVLFRALEPERFLNPDERQGIVELLATFQAPRVVVLPSEWVQHVLWPLATGGRGEPLFYLGCLVSTAGALFFAGAWAFRSLHFGAFTRSREGRAEGSVPERVARRVLLRRSTPAERGAQLFEGLRRQRGSLSFAREMRRKDTLSFLRDTAQWTQLLLLGALVVIYLLNFRYVQKMGEGGIIGPVGLYFANLGLAGFVITAISVRFVFPTVSLEGRAFWLVRAAPQTTLRFLAAKWWALAPGLWVFGTLLTTVSNVMIGTEPRLSLLAVLFQTPVTLSVVALGVALGAIYPRFAVHNPAQIAAGFGGFVYMVLGVGLNLVVVLLSIGPTVLVLGRRVPFLGYPSTGTAVALGAACLLVPPIVGLVALRLAARRLEGGR